jgi:hypothetical protein
MRIAVRAAGCRLARSPNGGAPHWQSASCTNRTACKKLSSLSGIEANSTSVERTTLDRPLCGAAVHAPLAPAQPPPPAGLASDPACTFVGRGILCRGFELSKGGRGTRPGTAKAASEGQGPALQGGGGRLAGRGRPAPWPGQARPARAVTSAEGYRPVPSSFLDGKLGFVGNVAVPQAHRRRSPGTTRARIVARGCSFVSAHAHGRRPLEQPGIPDAPTQPPPPSSAAPTGLRKPCT